MVVADWKRNEFMAEPEFCDEFLKVDLRELDNCLRAAQGCHHVYNLAADMGGMGFIESNQSVLMWNNTMVSSNVLEAARRHGAERYFYSSTACVYNEDLQLDPSNPGLKEADAWPAKPQEVYGLEKLYHEEMALAYARDFPLVTRIARCVRACVPSVRRAVTGSGGAWDCSAHSPHPNPQNPTPQLPQRLRALWDLEGRPREGPRRLLPQGERARMTSIHLT